MIADTVIYGKVFTAEKNQPYAEGFAVKDGKIIVNEDKL